jgi:tripartite-type tricarboxylate transporter receptor subunit TctC
MRWGDGWSAGSDGLFTGEDVEPAHELVALDVATLEVPLTAPAEARAAVQDAMGGTLHVAIESISALAAPMNAGLLKGLAVAAPTRLPEFADRGANVLHRMRSR